MTATLNMNTESPLAESEASPATGKLERSDWWLSSPSRRAVEDTELVVDQDAATADTCAVSPRTTPKPVKKSELGIRLKAGRKVLLQQWECVVLAKDDEVVCCEMHDLTDETKPSEYAEIFLRQFNAYDRPLLVEGAVFYWSMGYRQKQSGQILNVSEFILRRTPRLTRTQNSEITGKVARLRELLPTL